MNMLKKTGLMLVGLYTAATLGKNIELYYKKIKPLEDQFLTTSERIINQYGTPLPDEFLLREEGELTQITRKRRQVAKDLPGVIDLSIWELRKSGRVDLDTAVYALYPFFKIE